MSEHDTQRETAVAGRVRGWWALALQVWGDHRPPDWHAHAACRHGDPRWWDGEDSNHDRARTICNSCPVRLECLDEAARWENQDRPAQPATIVGGQSAASRSYRYAQQRLGVPISG